MVNTARDNPTEGSAIRQITTKTLTLLSQPSLCTFCSLCLKHSYAIFRLHAHHVIKAFPDHPT